MQTDDCRKKFDVEINNLLHRMNLDRSDIASLPDGATISINITTHRQAADLIKRMQAAWNRHTPQADSPFFKIGQMLFDANNKEAAKASEQPDDLTKHVAYHIEHMISRDNYYTPEQIAESAIRAVRGHKRESASDKQADVTLIEKLRRHKSKWDSTEYCRGIDDAIAILRQHTPTLPEYNLDKWNRILADAVSWQNHQSAKAVSLGDCAMALQGNQRIKLGSDLQVIAKAVLDEAGVKYVD